MQIEEIDSCIWDPGKQLYMITINGKPIGNPVSGHECDIIMKFLKNGKFELNKLMKE